MDGGHASVHVGVVHLWDGVLVGCKARLECSALTIDAGRRPRWCVLHTLQWHAVWAADTQADTQTEQQHMGLEAHKITWKCTKPPVTKQLQGNLPDLAR